MDKASPPLCVTKTFLPPRQDFYRYLEMLFDSRILTNHGGLVHRLEAELGAYLESPHLSVCANGTLALMLALRLAGLSGKKVVTTPFTYVATLSAMLWEGCTPVFADIDAESLCLSPASLRGCLEQHNDVAGVIPVHVFGNACDVEGIELVCREHGILCIYDAAHAFGASYKQRSLPDYGDYSICSFHATKLFHTVEGGCLISHSGAARREASLLRAFGHVNDDYFSLGINAKMSELHAAMGLALLPLLEGVIAARRDVCLKYEALLPADRFFRPVPRQGLRYNYAYFPIVLDSERTLLSLKAALEQEQIFPRRYFYPSLTTLSYLPESARCCPCPVADDIAPRTLCLPLHAELEDEAIERVARIVSRVLQRPLSCRQEA